MTFYRMLGSNIYTIMEQKDISVETLAERTGFSNNDIKKILTGRLILVPQDISKLSEALSVSYADITKKNNNDAFIHCEGEFSDLKNREKILDLIDSYIDIREICHRIM